MKIKEGIKIISYGQEAIVIKIYTIANRTFLQLDHSIFIPYSNSLRDYVEKSEIQSIINNDLSECYSFGLTQCFDNEENREEYVRLMNDVEITFPKNPTFNEWFRFNLESHNQMIEQMKWFIYKNWEKITDWSDINIQIKNKLYAKKHIISDRGGVVDRLFEEFNKKIIEIKWVNFVYDTFDSDLSIAINKKSNWKFMTDNEIIEIALYMNNKLSNE